MIGSDEDVEASDTTIEQQALEYCNIELHGYLDGANRKRLDFQDPK